MSQNKKLLIVANAPSQNTQALADAALRGAGNSDINNVDTVHISPLKAEPGDVLSCDAILLGTTENFGYMSGALKDFFDRIYYPCLEHTEALPYGVYIRAGQDGTGTQLAIDRIVTGMKWKKVQDTVLCRGEFQSNFINQVEELGMAMAAGLDVGLY